MINIKVKGDFKNTEKFFSRSKNSEFFKHLDDYGRKGVEALRLATPKDTGVTADSWDYEIDMSHGQIIIAWMNNNKTKTGIPIVILVQYGHGTRNGGYVIGRDFINPATQPVFDAIAEDVWKEVSK